MESCCPRCQTEAVECDDTQTFCQGCGFVISQDAALAPEHGVEGQQCGHYVADNGRVPGIWLMLPVYKSLPPTSARQAHFASSSLLQEKDQGKIITTEAY